MPAILLCAGCGTALASSEGACAQCGAMERTLQCGAREALYLASLVGGKFVVGIPDAFSNCTRDELADLWKEARLTLRAAGVLRDAAGSPPVILEPVAGWIRAISSPSHVFVVRALGADRTLQADRCLYESEDAVVDLGASGDTLTIRARPDLDFLADDLKASWQLEGVRPSPIADFSLSEEAFSRCRHTVVEGTLSAALEGLTSAGVPPLAARTLLLTLAAPTQSSALVRLAWTGSAWDTTGFGVLGGEVGAWIVRLRGEGFDFEAGGEADVLQEIRTLTHIARAADEQMVG